MKTSDGYKYEHPYKPGVLVSRQRLYQIRKAAEGLCIICAKPVTHYAMECDDCRPKNAAQIRRRLGLKPWRQGSPGRKPYVLDKRQKVA